MIIIISQFRFTYWPFLGFWYAGPTYNQTSEGHGQIHLDMTEREQGV
jgi:hypothetical protein